MNGICGLIELRFQRDNLTSITTQRAARFAHFALGYIYLRFQRVRKSKT